MIIESITAANARQELEQIKAREVVLLAILEEDKEARRRQEAEEIEKYGEVKRTDIPKLYLDFYYPPRKNSDAGLWQVTAMLSQQLRRSMLPHMDFFLDKTREWKARSGKGDGFNQTHVFSQFILNGLKDPRNISYLTDEEICFILDKER